MLGPGNTSFPSSPVIYARKPGMYSCVISSGIKSVESIIFTVKLKGDKLHEPKSISTPYGRHTRQPTLKLDTTASAMEYKVTEIVDATKNFSRNNVIGEGGYGKVYKGILRGCMEVAIKVLTKEGKDATTLMRENQTSQMQAEISTLIKYRHPNIVPLYGYCLKPPCLVYEFMANGSLYDKLHKSQVATSPLTIDQRSSILQQTLRGLVYLHGAKPGITHQDIKSANILLNSSLNAKLGDFGFCIALPDVSGGRSTFTTIGFARSEGYYPTEVTSGRYSDKSDVYSFGIVMQLNVEIYVVLETYTGQLAFDATRADCKLCDHFSEELTSLEEFQKISDSKITVCDSDAKIYFEVVKMCLKPHSRRPHSHEVLHFWNSK